MNMPLVLLNRRRRGGATAFSPSTLFALAEPGVWFDPSDLTTLFQDPAGTTPVTAPGNTVGLMLDKSKGLALGAETVANPGNPFVSTTGYSAGGSATISVDTGRLKVSQTTGFTDGVLCALPNSTFTTTTVVSFDVDLGSSSFVQVQAGNGNFGSGNVITLNIFTSGTHSIKTTTLASGFCGLSFKGASAGDFFLSRVSVKSLAGNHATQATLTARPTYSIEPVGGRRNLLTYSEQFDTPFVASTGWEKTSATALGTTVTVSAGGRLAQYFARSPQADYVAKVIASGTGTIVFGIMTGGYATIASQTIILTSTPTAYTIAGSLAGGATLVGLTFSSSAGATATLSATQLELGSTATPYQKVTTQHDVTEAGVASVGYLYFDGTDDNMTTTVDTNTIFGVTGADPGYLLVGGVKYNAAGGAASAFARSAFCGDSAGYFSMWAHTVNGGEAGLYQWDTTVRTAERPYVVGSSAVFTGRRNPSEGAAGKIYASVNGVSSAGTDAAALSAVSGTLLVGKQFGTFLNGHIYSLIARGALTDAPTITNTETWVAGKTGITI